MPVPDDPLRVLPGDVESGDLVMGQAEVVALPVPISPLRIVQPLRQVVRYAHGCSVGSTVATLPSTALVPALVSKFADFRLSGLQFWWSCRESNP